MATLAHDVSGAGARTLVFLHGITADRTHWEPVVERLADRHRCINVDLAGHGDSRDVEPVDLFGQLTAVSALLDELALDRPVLVGHSYGGMVATLVGATRSVGGVVNVDQRFDMADFRSVIEPLAPRLRGDDFAAAFDEFLATLRPELIPPERRAAALDHMRPRQEVVLAVWEAVLDVPSDELTEQVAATLPAVSSPYLGLFGDELSADERRLQSLPPEATFEVWDGHGHFLHLVDPDRATERIAAFVEGPVASAR